MRELLLTFALIFSVYTAPCQKIVASLWDILDEEVSPPHIDSVYSFLNGAIHQILAAPWEDSPEEFDCFSPIYIHNRVDVYYNREREAVMPDLRSLGDYWFESRQFHPERHLFYVSMLKDHEFWKVMWEVENLLPEVIDRPTRDSLMNVYIDYIDREEIPDFHISDLIARTQVVYNYNDYIPFQNMRELLSNYKNLEVYDPGIELWDGSRINDTLLFVTTPRAVFEVSPYAFPPDDLKPKQKEIWMQGYQAAISDIGERKSFRLSFPIFDYNYEYAIIGVDRFYHSSANRANLYLFKRHEGKWIRLWASETRKRKHYWY
ncbi:MAG: hypothetical protein LUF87_01735 [Alistipes sp.]|nr:hypothetical protein [Alistipes sp.]